jgi:hypothetical protein
VMGAGFQSDVSGGSDDRVPLRLGIAQSHDLGVGASGALGVTLAK